MGLSASVDESQIAEEVEKLMKNARLRRRMSRRAKEIIDGYGLFRTKNIVDGVLSGKIFVDV
jgi:23S rRNA U2552 (ribose-2'-O)-methylase RlmE/FtsJ